MYSTVYVGHVLRNTEKTAFTKGTFTFLLIVTCAYSMCMHACMYMCMSGLLGACTFLQVYCLCVRDHHPDRSQVGFSCVAVELGPWGLSLSPYLRHKLPHPAAATAAALPVLVHLGIDEEPRLTDELNCCGRGVRMITELPTHVLVAFSFWFESGNCLWQKYRWCTHLY